MNRKQILETLSELAKINGVYARFKMSLSVVEKNDPEGYEEFMTDLENQKLLGARDLGDYLNRKSEIDGGNQ